MTHYEVPTTPVTLVNEYMSTFLDYPGGLGQDVTKYTISRTVLNQEVFDDIYDSRPRPTKTLKDRVKKKKEKCTCNGRNVRRFVFKHLPFINIMKNYNIRTDLINDTIAGCTSGIMQMPQGKILGQTLIFLTSVMVHENFRNFKKFL